MFVLEMQPGVHACTVYVRTHMSTLSSVLQEPHDFVIVLWKIEYIYILYQGLLIF